MFVYVNMYFVCVCVCMTLFQEKRFPKIIMQFVISVGLRLPYDIAHHKQNSSRD